MGGRGAASLDGEGGDIRGGAARDEYHGALALIPRDDVASQKRANSEGEVKPSVASLSRLWSPKFILHAVTGVCITPGADDEESPLPAWELGLGPTWDWPA